MVTKIWSESLYPKIKEADDFAIDQFHKSQWQKKSGVSIYFLVYRWISGLLLLVYAVTSLFEKDPLSRPSLFYPKYPIYITNWMVWIACVQGLLATGIVTYYFIRLKQKEGVEENNIWIQRIIKVYWPAQTVTIVASIAISVVFWVLIYNPEINFLNIFTFTSHGGIAVYMVIDALIVAHPFRLTDYYWTLLLTVIYGVFSFLYYILGGTDRFNRNFIYSILDWDDAGSALLTITYMSIFILFVHFVVWCLTYSTRKLIFYMNNKEEEKPKKTIETIIDIIDTDAPIGTKQ